MSRPAGCFRLKESARPHPRQYRGNLVFAVAVEYFAELFVNPVARQERGH